MCAINALIQSSPTQDRARAQVDALIGKKALVFNSPFSPDTLGSTSVDVVSIW